MTIEWHTRILTYHIGLLTTCLQSHNALLTLISWHSPQYIFITFIFDTSHNAILKTSNPVQKNSLKTLLIACTLDTLSKQYGIWINGHFASRHISQDWDIALIALYHYGSLDIHLHTTSNYNNAYMIRCTQALSQGCNTPHTPPTQIYQKVHF